MKHIRKFYEELKPETYKSAAAGKLNVHGDVEAAKRLRDWAKKVEGGGNTYDISYVCIRDGAALYWGHDYTARMALPKVVGVYYGSTRQYTREALKKNSMADVIERWVGSGRLSVSMVVQFQKTEERSMKWVYEVTVAGQKIGEAGDQTQRIEIESNSEKDALDKLNNSIKSAYPKIIGRPVDSDVVKVKLVERPSLGMSDAIVSKMNGVGWNGHFGPYAANLDTFVIEVSLSSAIHGLRERYACDACGGAVNMDCYECGGEGYVYDEETDRDVPCTVCNETGTITCEECEGREGRDRAEGVTHMKFFEDTFRPEVYMRPIPGKTSGVSNDTAYSEYPWIGMFDTRDDARRFIANDWRRLIEQIPPNGVGGVKVSLYEAVTDLVKELVDVNDSDAVEYVEAAVGAMENISVGAMVVDKGNRAARAVKTNVDPINISTYKVTK